jgi:catabolite regulation protein CreA
MIESSIQENGTVESIFKFPTTLTKKLVIVENIYDKKILMLMYVAFRN